MGDHVFLTWPRDRRVPSWHLMNYISLSLAHWHCGFMWQRASEPCKSNLTILGGKEICNLQSGERHGSAAYTCRGLIDCIQSVPKCNKYKAVPLEHVVAHSAQELIIIIDWLQSHCKHQVLAGWWAPWQGFWRPIFLSFLCQGFYKQRVIPLIIRTSHTAIIHSVFCQKLQAFVVLLARYIKKPALYPRAYH